MLIAAKTMYSNCKMILGHNTNDFGYKNIVEKIKYFSHMSNSMIFGGHFENMQIRSIRRHFSACQHCFWIQRTKLLLIKMSNPFLHKMPVLVNFSDFFS